MSVTITDKLMRVWLVKSSTHCITLPFRTSTSGCESVCVYMYRIALLLTSFSVFQTQNILGTDTYEIELTG